jgi:hypothetical protein
MIITVRMLWVVAAALPLVSCGADGGVRVEGPAPSGSARSGPVYVLDAVGAGPLQRPRAFALTEFTTLGALRWTSWGGATAEATGEVTGSWCLPACEKKGYPAKVVLSGLAEQERSAYYSRAAVTAPGVPPEQAAEIKNVQLPTRPG